MTLISSERVLKVYYIKCTFYALNEIKSYHIYDETHFEVDKIVCTYYVTHYHTRRRIYDGVTSHIKFFNTETTARINRNETMLYKTIISGSKYSLS